MSAFLAVIIAADTKVDKACFVKKQLYETSTKAAIHNGTEVVEKAIAEATLYRPVAAMADEEAKLYDQVAKFKAERSAARTGAYKHLMTGVSYMLSLVVAGSIVIALAFAVGGVHVFEDQNEGTLGVCLKARGRP